MVKRPESERVRSKFRGLKVLRRKEKSLISGHSPACVSIETCLIIHLKSATERSEQVRKLRQSVPMDSVVIDAIDGRSGRSETAEISTAYRPMAKRPSYPFPLRQTEIATFLSHRKCWQYIVDNNLPAALIFEDDVDLNEAVLAAALALVRSNLHQGDFVRLPIKDREAAMRVVAESGECSLFEPSVIGLGMVGQIVTRDAAEYMLCQTENFDRPVDSWMQLVARDQMRVLSVWPNGVKENSAAIGGSLIGQSKSIKERLQREVLRPIYRAKVGFFGKRIIK